MRPKPTQFHKSGDMTSSGSNGTFPHPDRMTWFKEDDPRSPINFSLVSSPFEKLHIVCAGIICTVNSALGSSLPSGAVDYIAQYFRVTSHSQLVLLNSLYLVGLVVGPLIFGPMSECLGRRPVLVGTYVGYTVFTMACALSPTYTALLIFRLLCGVNGAAPNAVIGGLYADIFDTPQQRGKAVAYFAYITTLGPQFGPIISGFVSVVSWRWTFWVGLIVAGVGLPVIVLLPETYVPVLIKRGGRQAEKIDMADGAAHQPHNTHFTERARALAHELKVVFTRPFVMTIQEPVLLSTSLYVALIYAVLYLFLQAYPIVFQGIYGLIMAGATISLITFLWYASYHSKAVEANVPWARIEEYRRLPLACAGGPTIVVALFWLGWSSSKSIHPLMPMMSGLWFGTGYLLIFMAMLTYLTDVYKQFSASAQAAASTTRSIAAVCLPLATKPIYDTLGVQWTTSLLGFLALAMAAIPFIFIRYRESIRGKSPFAQRARQAASSQYTLSSTGEGTSGDGRDGPAKGVETV